jgi:hypothetical protein
LHGIASQKTTVEIFTAMRTLYFNYINHLKPSGNYMSHLLRQSVTINFVQTCFL